MKRSLSVRGAVLALATLGLALPACAHAASYTTISATGKGPRKYRLSVTAAKTPFAGGNVTVDAFKSHRGSTEDHSVQRNNGATYSANASLTKGKVKTSFGSYGAISMRFVGTGRKKSVKLDHGCKGTKGASRSGILTGKLKIRFVKRGGYTKRLRLKAVLTRPPEVKSCVSKPISSGHEYSLTPAQHQGGVALDFERNKHSKTVFQTASINSFGKKLSVFHSITARKSGAKYFSPSTDLTKASVKGISPYITGSLKYAASPGNSSSTFSSGSMSGTIRVHFDFVGTKTVKPKTGNLSLF